MQAAKGREFIYRAIVERHLRKHTGLPHSAKACPDGVPAGGSPQGRQVGGPGVTTSATAQGAISADPGESLWEFHSIKSTA
jgi:hypothetical protein